MKISLNWLNKYVEVKDIEANQLASLITDHAVEVGGVTPMAQGTKLVIGYVKERENHPDSDHLNVCQVDIGDSVQQIVCGAKNVDAGQKVIVAVPGCVLPGITIKQSVIRGVESNGMICSLSELGFEKSLLTETQLSGIEVLPSDAPIGENPLTYMGWDDVIIELDLTPNRADCLSMLGFAHDVAAVLDRKINLPEINYIENSDEKINIEVKTDKCSVFASKVIRNVTVKESPQWLKDYLTAAGVKVINNIVDITNFVLLEYGQPLHAYDLAKLENDTLVVDVDQEISFEALDDKEYTTNKDDVVISTGNRVACLAGVIGANSTKVSEETVDIVLEAAIFDHVAVRNTSRRNQLFTDASVRYIKKVNPRLLKIAIDRAASLIQEIASPKSISKTSFVGKVEDKYSPIKLTFKDIEKVLGVALEVDTITKILDRLSFEYQVADEMLVIEKPAHRMDIEIKEDIIEEIGRIYGYNNIPMTMPKGVQTSGGYLEFENKVNLVRDLMVGLGLQEVITYSLIEAMNDNQYKLISPMTEQRIAYRDNLLVSMLEILKYNQARQNNDVSIFEIANCQTLTNSHQELGVILAGNYQQTLWQGYKKQVDFYVLKGIVESLLEHLGINVERYRYEPVTDNQNYHPGRSANLIIQGKTVGVLGQLHPKVAKNSYALQINLSDLLEVKSGKLKVEPISIYPSVSRDIAIVVNKDVSSGDIIKVIKQAGKKLLNTTEVFDVYESDDLGEGKKSLAINLKFVDITRTLNEEEVNETVESILKNLESKYNAILRT